MGRSTIPSALIELSNPSTPEAQVNALRNLKNEIVGHEQRKELTILHGIVGPLARILRGETRKGGKRRRVGGATNGSSGVKGMESVECEWEVEDELRFQATLVVGSLANGGPAFITPLLAGDVLPPLLEALSPAGTPSKLIVTTLRTLNQFADAVTQEKPCSGATLLHAINRQIYTKPVVESLAEILEQTSRSRTIYQQISLAAQLIIKTCAEESQRRLLLETGVLELFAGKMTAVAAKDDPSRRQISLELEALPTMYLPDILEAIATIIKDSYYNTARFLYSEAVQNVFGWPEGASKSYEELSQSPQSNWDTLIPRLQTLQSKSDAYTRSWPALGAHASAGGENYLLPSVDSMQQTSGRNIVTDESETPLFTWLIFVARRGEGRERLAACWLLALLKKFGERWQYNDPSKATRERHFSYLIIPLVVKMIEEVNPTSELAKKISGACPAQKAEIRIILERSPLVLAELCFGNKALQKAAVEARILPVLSQILKKSFEPVTSCSKPLWQPKNAASPVRDPMSDPASSMLGRLGLSADVLHAYRYRESTLLALAAIGDSQDEYRKVIIEMGTATHIIDSLVPYQNDTGDASSSTKASTSSAKDGNPDAVIVAACTLTRSLSRSISILRTSLIDHGIARPIFDLLTHPNVKVQAAATEVITNLVLDVSPMRTDIIEAGALRTLCEHCRSANFDLRFGSLWALKHLCLGLPLNMRIHCLEELGIGWLMQVLSGELSRPTPLSMGTSNAAGERVDILNAAVEHDPHMDLDDDFSSSEDEDTMIDEAPSLRRLRQGARYKSILNIRDRMQQIKNDEQDARLIGERDDVRIQEQALDFLRNFITGDPVKSSGEMIDHLLKSFGHSAFFEVLDSKLRPKVAITSSTSSTSPPNPPTIYWSPTRPGSRSSHFTSHQNQPSPQPQILHLNPHLFAPSEILSATLFILVHLANGRPTHRSLLLSQSTLLSHILPLFNHPMRTVRLPIVWLVNNIVHVDDASDEAAARERAMTLRNAGFEDGVRQCLGDVDLDVRERAKTAVEQIGKLLGGSNNSSGGGTGGAAGGGFGGSGYASPGAFGEGGGLRGGLGSLHPSRGSGRWGGGGVNE